MKPKILLTFILMIFLVPSIFAAEVNVADFIGKFASNGSTDDAIGDYTTSNGIFKLQPPENETWIISRMLVNIRDSGSMSSGAYGANINLVNGILVQSNISNVLNNLTNGERVLTNTQWAHYSYDTQVVNFGAGDSIINVRWTFSKSGTFIRLNGTLNDSINVVLEDDFSGLNEHHFIFQGFVSGTGDETEKDVLDEINAAENGKMWIAIIIGMVCMTGLLFYSSSLIKSKEAESAKVFLYFMGVIYTFLIPTTILTIIFNPTNVSTFEPLGLTYFSVGILCLIYYIYVDGARLIKRLLFSKPGQR